MGAVCAYPSAAFSCRQLADMPVHPSRIRYTKHAAAFLDRLREQSEDAFHALRGLIIQLAAAPEIDNAKKFLKAFGSGQAVPVYADDKWGIVYRVDRVDSADVFVVPMIWDASSSPNLRL